MKVVHLESGRAAGLNAHGRFPMASVYKLPLAVVVLAKVDAGELSLEQEVEVRPGELRRTGAKVDAWKPGSRVPLGKLVDAMMTASDNTACDVLLRLLGGPRAVDAWLDAHGYPEIDVSWSELTMAAVASGVADLAEGRRRATTPASTLSWRRCRRKGAPRPSVPSRGTRATRPLPRTSHGSSPR